MKIRLLALLAVMVVVATSIGQNRPKGEDFYAAIREGKLSLEGSDYYTNYNTTNAGGDFPRKIELLKIEANQVTVIEKNGKVLVIPRSKISAIVRVEGAGK